MSQIFNASFRNAWYKVPNYSVVFTRFVDVVVVFRCRILSFNDLRELWCDLEILHEAAVLEHRRSTLETTALNLDVLATNAAVRLLHVLIKAIINALLLVLNIVWLISDVEVRKLDRAEGEGSRHLLAEGPCKVLRVVKVELDIFVGLLDWLLLLFFSCRLVTFLVLSVLLLLRFLSCSCGKSSFLFCSSTLERGLSVLDFRLIILDLLTALLH